jgi:hypothetical protein
MITQFNGIKRSNGLDILLQQMIKLEEDISLMEEQSVSDLDDTQQEDYTTSQVVGPLESLFSKSANHLKSSVSGV